MTQRQLAILASASVLVLGLAAWVTHHNQQGTRTRGARVLAGLEAALNTVTAVRLTGASGEHTTLERGTKRWMVRERGYPADSGKLRKLLIDLGSLRVEAHKTRLAQNYPILGVESLTDPKASGSRIDVISPGKTWSLIVGHSADGNDCYVRVVGHKQSLLASPLVRIDARAAQWLDPIVLDIARKRISAIEERPARGARFEASRAEAGQSDFIVHGIPRGRKLQSPGAADDMASALSNLTLSDVRQAAAAPKGAPLSHAVFKTFDGLEIDIAGYQAGKHGKHYIDVVARGGGKQAGPEAARINARLSGWEYQIPGYRYQEIFQPLSGLLAPPPTRHAKPRKKAA